MGRILRSCLQSLLKLVNSIIGMVGLGMVLYSLWMIRMWYKNVDGDAASQVPWFIYTFLGLGVSICVIACSGHVAAETVYSHCLSCYMVFIFVLILLEAAVTADIFLNSHWEEDFPEDVTGRLHDLKKFVKSNLDLCKWIGSLVVAAQGLSIILAMILRAFGPYQRRYYDSDDEYAHATVPLLKDRVHPPPYGTNPSYPTNNDPWNARVYEKTSRLYMRLHSQSAWLFCFKGYGVHSVCIACNSTYGRLLLYIDSILAPWAVISTDFGFSSLHSMTGVSSGF
ncbi:hypothetical protein H6P81_016882 [Aristolochia fimbriata]|uniref:Tetraspanin-19-like n=1 Tax=Aristolochia fimbriata TaxID=158543 RepID=A0AAV7DXH1_ARIFI|nr:hypothetical protein H6P81_016882 [Aristolochia fimbriata]